MLRFIFRIIIKWIGCKITGALPKEVKKCIIIMAPHTSNYDFFLGRMGFYILKIKPKLLIKKEHFKFPFGPLLKTVGGVPVDRGKNTNMVDNIVKMISENRSYIVLITPEGTRSYNLSWKKGFYYIALNAKVPIFLGYLDYKKKEGGVGPCIIPTGDYEKDFAVIESFYRNITPKHPERSNLCYTNNQ